MLNINQELLEALEEFNVVFRLDSEEQLEQLTMILNLSEGALLLGLLPSSSWLYPSSGRPGDAIPTLQSFKSEIDFLLVDEYSDGLNLEISKEVITQAMETLGDEADMLLAFTIKENDLEVALLTIKEGEE